MKCLSSHSSIQEVTSTIFFSTFFALHPMFCKLKPHHQLADGYLVMLQMSPHLSGWHAGSFRGNDSQFSEVLDTLQTTFRCPICTSNSPKEKKHQFPSCFCVSCVTLFSERGSLVVKTTLTEHFFRWGFCEKFLSHGLSAALKTAIKLPSKHKFAQRGSGTTKRISLFYIFQNIWSY